MDRSLKSICRGVLRAMATVAGYSVIFTVDNRVKQITMADPNDKVIEEWLVARFGQVQILSRTLLDAKALGMIQLKFGEWFEWAPLARR